EPVDMRERYRPRRQHECASERQTRARLQILRTVRIWVRERWTTRRITDRPKRVRDAAIQLRDRSLIRSCSWRSPENERHKRRGDDNISRTAHVHSIERLAVDVE